VIKHREALPFNAENLKYFSSGFNNFPASKLKREHLKQSTQIYLKAKISAIFKKSPI
jgi:hypothetical protein